MSWRPDWQRLNRESGRRPLFRRRRRGRRFGLRRRLAGSFWLVAVLAVVLTAALTFGAGWRALSQIDPQLAAGAANAADPAASDPATADPSTTGEGSGLSAAQVESLRAAARSFGRSAWQAGLLASLLAAVVPGLVARQLVRPLLRLEDAATRVAGGERGVRLPLPRSNDELRTVTAASTPWPRGWSARMPGGAA